MPIFSQFGEIVWQRLFNIARILQTTALNNVGECLYDIGSKGSGDGQFSCPTGLAIDRFNRLIVCDRDNNRLQLLTLDGKYVAKVAGSFFDHNTHLADCAVSDTGHCFVTDMFSTSTV